MVCGVCFSVVAARIAGMIGCSNLPASGMTLASLLVASLVLLKTGHTGTTGMLAAITVATLCCTAIATSGDISQDLKTGALLGATPSHQQIGQIIGVVATAGVISLIIYLLDGAWGFGSDKLPAPQANLMKTVTEGVMAGTMPWTLVVIGIFVTLILTALGISPMSVALGTFLPFSLSMTLVLGGLVRHLVDRMRPEKTEHGILFCSGLITGEGLMGIALAILTVSGHGSAIDLSRFLNLGNIGAAGTIVLAMVTIFLVTGEREK
ncbi:MAG: OPT/YSL family transporter [Victivallaceae bacterium]|nr:OPT/YSL family transporter [Victivallaceae bacterium]